MTGATMTGATTTTTMSVTGSITMPVEGGGTPPSVRVDTTPGVAPAGGETAGGESGGGDGTAAPDESGVLATMTRLLQAQTEALAAQTRAAAAQHLPPLKPFSGEGKLTEEDSFEQWVERFEERASLVSWSEAQKLHQLKLLLEKTASRVFQMFGKEDKASYASAKAALKTRFWSVDIEELRGMEFHRLVQIGELVEELRMEIQRLGHRAFPSVKGKDLDRLLKGRFFQALHVRWQRKLGAPMVEETFQELYDRARMAEQREKQYAELAALHGNGDNNKKGDKDKSNKSQRGGYRKTGPSTQSSGGSEKSGGNTSGQNPPPRLCYSCQQPGHISRDCPRRSKCNEAPGRTPDASGTATLEVRSTGPWTVSPEDMPTEELERILAQRHLNEENQQMSSNTSVVTMGQAKATTAVGPTVCLPVNIEGMSVEALVDTGSQSTIISRSMLRAIARRLEERGQSLPTLELPTAQLYGKDGRGGGCELVITAQLQLTIEVDGKSANVIVFVQPDSEQQCLLGMNALPDLGLTITRANGEPLIVKSGEEPVVSGEVPVVSSEPIVSHVRLVKLSTIPCRKGRILKARMEGVFPQCTEDCRPPILFEPRSDDLASLGLGCHESLVTMDDEGCMLVPVDNREGVNVRLEEGFDLGTVRYLDRVTGEMRECFESVSVIDTEVVKP